MPKVNKPNTEFPAFDLLAAREARGMTQEAVATLLFIHQTTIARWEREGNMPGIARMAWSLHWQVQDAKSPKPVKGKKNDTSKTAAGTNGTATTQQRKPA